MTHHTLKDSRQWHMDMDPREGIKLLLMEAIAIVEEEELLQVGLHQLQWDTMWVLTQTTQLLQVSTVFLARKDIIRGRLW